MNIDFSSVSRKMFVLALVWLLVEGVFRKWLFYSIAGPLFYIKYIFFFFSYFFYIIEKRTLIKYTHPYQLFILFFIFICAVGFIKTRSSNPVIVGIIGIVVHLFFLPLIHFLQYFFTTIDSVNKFIRIFTITTFPICILGMFQFYLPTDHPINGYVNEEQLITRVGEFTRISSVFPFVKLYNAYLLLGISIITGAILNRLLQSKPILLEVASLLLLLINTFMTGSRLPLGLIAFNLFIIGSFVFINFSFLRKTITVTFTVGIIGMLIMYTSMDVLKDPIDATIKRFELAESRHRGESTGYTDVQLRIDDRLDIFKFSKEAGWFGYGVGMTYQGTQNFIKKPIPFYFEEEGERIVLELGIIGGVISILLRLTFFIYSFQIFSWCKSIEIKLILLPLLLYILPGIFTLQNISFSYLENFNYYFAIGLIIALYKIQQKEITQQN